MCNRLRVSRGLSSHLGRTLAHAGLVAFNWFLGDNDLKVALYDAATGGCRDGLHPDRANENQGAESTLSFLMALLEMRQFESFELPETIL